MDIELMAEWHVVERLFGTPNTIQENTITAREKEIRQLASSLFIMNFDAETCDELLFGPNCAELDVVSEYYDKAEKIYELANDYDSAKVIINFLKALNPKLSKMIIDKL